MSIEIENCAKKYEELTNSDDTIVAMAKYLFPVLRTLVAPMFPDPTSLISLPLKALVKIKPKGIDPQKYEKTATKKISIST